MKICGVLWWSGELAFKVINLNLETFQRLSDYDRVGLSRNGESFEKYFLLSNSDTQAIA